jgi:hypothetical protein
MTKQCSICKKVLPATEFPKNTQGINGLHPYCRICHAAKQRGYRQRRRDEDGKYYEQRRQDALYWEIAERIKTEYWSGTWGQKYSNEGKLKC